MAAAAAGLLGLFAADPAAAVACAVLPGGAEWNWAPVLEQPTTPTALASLTWSGTWCARGGVRGAARPRLGPRSAPETASGRPT
jgi:hypothetical protein